MKHLVIVCCIVLAGSAAAADRLTAVVRAGDCREQVLAQGELRAVATENIHAPEMEEHYLTVKSVAENGARVKAGDVVMEFDDVLYQLALKAATQDVALKAAQRDLQKFQLDDERIKSDIEIKRKEIALAKAQAEVVRDASIVSQVDQKKAELSVELAQLELAQARSNRQEFEKKYEVSLKVKDLELADAQHKLDHARACLAKIVVRAPKDGVIYKPFVRLNNEKGQVERNKVVRPGDKLLEIPSFEKFEGVLNLPAADVRFVQPGDPVSLRLTTRPDATFRGTVLRKDPYPTTRNERLGRDDAEGHLKEFEVIVALDATDPSFRPGSTFTATIDATLARGALFVPAAAVRTEAGRTFVLTPVPGGPARTPVTVGATGYAYAVITAGLTAGQTVLLGE